MEANISQQLSSQCIPQAKLSWSLVRQLKLLTEVYGTTFQKEDVNTVLLQVMAEK